jgi:hypothetical protein
VLQIPAEPLEKISDDALKQLLVKAIELTAEDRKQNQILWYKPVSSQALAVHECAAKTVGIGGGNGSSKTEVALTEVVMAATGVFPKSLAHLAEAKFRGPIQCRIVCESLTTVLHPIILPKLQWWRWSGADEPGGERGHWGWVPKASLIDGDWQKSWSEKLRTLRLICRNPQTGEMVGESSIQFMSVDQEPSDFASGDFHLIVHDEPPTHAIWRENEARTMRVGGRMLLSMTWPDDPAIAVDWIFNEIYEPGLNPKEESVRWFTLSSFDNPHLRQDDVHKQAAKWSAETAKVRIHGEPLRFSNRIHPDFTDFTKTWCFPCGKSVVPMENEAHKMSCPHCASDDIETYNHVAEFDPSPSWPTIFLLDPHPRKPHMYSWIQVDPSDDLWQIAEGEMEGEPADVKKDKDRIERELGLWVKQSLMDPNMGASPSGVKREITWQNEFQAAGIYCDLSDDSEVGRKRVNAYLKPDRGTRRPRLHVHPRCKNTIYQVNRFVWEDYKKALEKDQKQTPKAKYDDYAALWRYCLNSDPQFNILKYGAPVFRRTGTRKGGYG